MTFVELQLQVDEILTNDDFNREELITKIQKATNKYKRFMEEHYEEKIKKLQMENKSYYDKMNSAEAKLSNLKNAFISKVLDIHIGKL